MNTNKNLTEQDEYSTQLNEYFVQLDEQTKKDEYKHADNEHSEIFCTSRKLKIAIYNFEQFHDSK